MGELQHEPFQFTFNGLLKVEFQGARVTSDAGLLLVRELDERLGLERLITDHLRDSRQGLNTQFRLADLLRQSVYSRLAGDKDLNDAERLATDPTFRLIGSPKRWDRGGEVSEKCRGLACPPPNPHRGQVAAEGASLTDDSPRKEPSQLAYMGVVCFRCLVAKTEIPVKG